MEATCRWDGGQQSTHFARPWRPLLPAPWGARQPRCNAGHVRGGQRRIAPVVSVSGAGFRLLAMGIDRLVSPPLSSLRALSGGPRSAGASCCLACWLRWLLCLCFVHIFTHVLYLTCFNPCVLTRLTRVCPVLGHAPISPRHTLPRFPFAFCRHCMPCPAFPFTFSCILCFRVPYFSSCGVPLTICFVRYLHCGPAARHDAAAFPSSHRSASTSQIVATTLSNPANLYPIRTNPARSGQHQQERAPLRRLL
jgi:hypothetical protein